MKLHIPSKVPIMNQVLLSWSRRLKVRGRENKFQWLKNTEVKVVLKWEIPTTFVLTESTLGSGNSPPQVSTYMIGGGSKFRPSLWMLLRYGGT